MLLWAMLLSCCCPICSRDPVVSINRSRGSKRGRMCLRVSWVQFANIPSKNSLMTLNSGTFPRAEWLEGISDPTSSSGLSWGLTRVVGFSCIMVGASLSGTSSMVTLEISGRSVDPISCVVSGSILMVCSSSVGSNPGMDRLLLLLDPISWVCCDDCLIHTG